MSLVREVSLDEDGKGYIVVGDDGTGTFVPIEVDVDRPLKAVQEALPYLEEHMVEGEQYVIHVYRSTYVAADNPTD